ncbi:unnamed protein product [Mesocestoides corti]|uniref:Dolichol-phosphate mannosyltransferase subunit 3 n=1 Tax=Mesocestoides corti TaxID=53468 RepID=A0A0R3U1V5_MESCO|nr:unnamed protein product [Mesocestoides corti]
MVKAAKWFICLFLFLTMWLCALYGPFHGSFFDSCVLYLPIIVIFFIGCLSLAYIVYGVVTFNDCPEEAKKLKMQIGEARRGLEKAGFKF